MCAKFRSGHFEGVLAVINQFLIKIKPSVMFLGKKDFQQIYLIKKFISGKFKTKIVQCKTIRNKNGLPYSSRNVLLNKKNFQTAVNVSQIIKKFYSTLKLNFKKTKDIYLIKNKIINKNVKLEYLEIRNKLNLSKKINKKNFKIFIAYYIDGIRLIDNF
jgi:pantoate--beta-alanine ligase